jgi:hypothetical protein
LKRTAKWARLRRKIDSGPDVNDFDDSRFTDLIGLRRSRLATLLGHTEPSIGRIQGRIPRWDGNARSGLQYVDNTTECFDGVMVQIREFLINARQWLVADQTFEQAQRSVLLRGFRDPEQRKGIPRLYQTFVRNH